MQVGSKKPLGRGLMVSMAEEVRFELTDPCESTVFKSSVESLKINSLSRIHFRNPPYFLACKVLILLARYM